MMSTPREISGSKEPIARLIQIAPEYSMFRMIVNYVREKSVWVEEL